MRWIAMSYLESGEAAFVDSSFCPHTTVSLSSVFRPAEAIHFSLTFLPP